MRIGLNGTAYDSLSSGARDRFLNLGGRVAARSAGDEFILYSPADCSLRPHFDGPAYAEFRAPLSAGSPLRRFLASRKWFDRHLTEDRVDLFITDHFPVLDRPRTLLTIHDLRFLVLPGEGSLARRAYFRLRFAETARRAAVIVTVSETIREEIVDRLGVPETKVHVVPNGVGEAYRRADPEAVAALRGRRGLPEEYFLAVGVLERRKNLRRLIEAYGLDKERALPPLVLTGRGGREEKRLRRRATSRGVIDRIRFIGYTPEEEMPALYTGATALLAPSLYEGFGLPVIQAFACGVPVLCSGRGALREVAAEAALYRAPDDTEGWLDGMLILLDQEKVRERFIAGGHERAKVYSWDAAAERFAGVLDGLRDVD